MYIDDFAVYTRTLWTCSLVAGSTTDTLSSPAVQCDIFHTVVRWVLWMPINNAASIGM